MRGKPRRARKLLEESLPVAERQSARFEHARTLLAHGQVGLAMGWPGAAGDVRSARETLRSMGADFALDRVPAGDTAAVEPQATLSLAGRFSTVLEAGRKITLSLTRDAVFAAAREAALSLLRGEICLILERAADGGLTPWSPGAGEPTRGYGEAAVHQAIESRRPFAATEGAEGPAAESMSGPRLAIEVQVEPPDFPPVPPEVAVNLFRIAQAALANVVRHARARSALLKLAAVPGAIRFEVSDDGIGFDSERVGRDDALGLAGMRERAAWAGGSFALESGPQRGTRVRIEVPITERSDRPWP